jgi:integrase
MPALWSGFGFHALRDICASLMFGEGRNAAQVQRRLGQHAAVFTPST